MKNIKDIQYSPFAMPAVPTAKLSGFSADGHDSQFLSMFKRSRRAGLVTDNKTPPPPAFMGHDSLH